MDADRFLVNDSFTKAITDVLEKVALERNDSVGDDVMNQIKVKSLETFNTYFKQEMNGATSSSSSVQSSPTQKIGQFIRDLMDKKWPDEKFQLGEITINTTDCPGAFSVDFKGSKHAISIIAHNTVEQGGRHPGPQVDVHVTKKQLSRTHNFFSWCSCS